MNFSYATRPYSIRKHHSHQSEYNFDMGDHQRTTTLCDFLNINFCYKLILFTHHVSYMADDK